MKRKDNLISDESIISINTKGTTNISKRNLCRYLDSYLLHYPKYYLEIFNKETKKIFCGTMSYFPLREIHKNDNYNYTNRDDAQTEGIIFFANNILPLKIFDLERTSINSKSTLVCEDRYAGNFRIIIERIKKNNCIDYVAKWCVMNPSDEFRKIFGENGTVNIKNGALYGSSPTDYISKVDLEKQYMLAIRSALESGTMYGVAKTLSSIFDI